MEMETECCQSPQPQPQPQPNQSSKGERYAILVARKEALEARIQERNEKLKRLCVAEAELTGVLPPEIPLEPGEAVPTFRRRVGTSFALPENLINKLKSEEEQAVSALELEYEIQSHITAAALQLANDCTGKKGLRKQRRCEYQQNHRRLQDLEARLKQIKITNASQKHRKKPRPSVDSESGGEPADREPRDIAMSPSKSTNHLIVSGGYLDVPYQSNTISHSYSHMHVLDTKPMKPQERLHATLSAPQYNKMKANSPDARRPQLQRLGSGGFFACGMYQQQQHQVYPVSPHYPTLSSCAHPELERMSRHDTAFIMSPHWSPYPGELMDPNKSPHVHQYGSGRVSAAPGHTLATMDEVDSREATELSSRHPSLEGRTPRWNRNRFGSLDRKKHMAHSNPCLESRSVEGLDVLQTEGCSDPSAYNNRAGYTLEKAPSSSSGKIMRHHDQIINHHNNIPPHVQALRDERAWRNQHYNKQHSSSASSATSHQSASVTGETLLPGQTYPEHSFGQVLTVPDRAGLTRTQSLGSVETPPQNTVANADTRSIKDMYPSTSYTQQKNYDASLRRQKEKEWYETSLDAPPPSRPPSRRPSGHSGYDMEIHPLQNNPPQVEAMQEPVELPYPRTTSEQTFHRTTPTNEQSYHRTTPTIEQPYPTRTNEQPYPRIKTPSRRPSGHSTYEIEPPPPAIQTEPISQLENIPAPSPTTSEYPKAKTEIAGNEYFDTVVPFESPKNHMVIQAGKWQPYWETTKPFEMSDFYKYSTKFRKKPEPTQPLRLEDVSNTPVPDSPTPSMSPQQKGIYQPLQPMTCQPIVQPVMSSNELNTSSALMVAPPDQQSPSPHIRNKLLSPGSNTSHDTSLTLPNGESLADAFSTEMLAWYQDKSSLPRSATLV